MTLRAIAYFTLAIFLTALLQANGKPLKFSHRRPLKVKQDFEKYKAIVDLISDYVLHGKGKGAAYQKLEWLVDTFGARMAGTDALENAIDGVVGRMTAESLDNVHTESAVVLNWRPKDYRLSVVAPRFRNLSILPLSPSISTPPSGIAAYALVVRNFTELDQRADEASGKIVVFNQNWVDYGSSVQYRILGAQKAAQYGAVGALVRSVTPLSIYSPHTGLLFYNDSANIPEIPVASITVEDAELLQRLSGGSSNSLLLHFYLQTENYGNFTSRNTIAEIAGNSKKNETVLISGHLDSWFAGVGAMDDGGGAIISWEALSVLNELGLRAARTVRTVLWTGEEQAGVGSHQYYEAHKNEVPLMDFVMESDLGTFHPSGLFFTGSPEAQAVMQQVLNLLAPLNATQLATPDDSTDIADWEAAGVPGASLINANDKYFYFHHSAGDTLTVENSDDLDLCVAIWASVAYIVADLDDMLPRSSSSQSRLRKDLNFKSFA